VNDLRLIDRVPHLRSRMLVALGGLVLAVGAAVSPAGASALGAGTPAPSLTWTDCGGGLQCATLAVPLDYDHPRAGTISLAVIREPATDPAHRIGSLVVNPGGPGGSGVQTIRQGATRFPAELRARFDLVGFDPRGVGQSTPVRCFANQAEQQAFFNALPPAFPATPAEDQQVIRAAAEFDRRCLALNPDLLAHVSTANAARDMDVLRQALGEQRLTYLGVSYGTYLGSTYANLFPDRVRALALDGVVEPVAWATGRQGQGHQLPTFIRETSDLGSSRTLGAFLDLCAAAGAAACPFAVGTDAAATRTRFQTLLARLKEQPVAVPTPQGTVDITYADTVALTLSGLYVEQEWPLVALVLQHLDEGDGTVFLQVLNALAPPSPTYDNTKEAQIAIICDDSNSPRDPDAWPALAAAADSQAPYFGSFWTWISVQCATWPVRDSDRFTGPFDHRTANPVLVVGNTFDPATPYGNAVALSRELPNSRLLTLDGWGHTAFSQPSTCALQAEIRYLVDLRLPAPGTVCRPDVGPFGGPVVGATRPVMMPAI
jgi:pimeloyl-ACP methyl ester carboxylesterase